MNVTISEALTVQLGETERFLKSVTEATGSSNRNDAKLFRPTLEALDKLTVAVHVARTPSTSFLVPQTSGARFNFDEDVSEALDRAVTYLQDPEIATVSQNSLSIYEFTVTTEPLGLLKSLYFGITQAVRKSAEMDLYTLHGGDVATFLAAVAIVRQWADDAS